MNTILWIVQGLVAFAFLMAGAMKLLKSKNELREKLGDWMDEYSDNAVKLIGLVEVLGAIGVVLPAALNILPVLTPIAALGLVLTMVGAIRTHLRRNENDKIIVNVVLLLLALTIAVGRYWLV